MTFSRICVIALQKPREALKVWKHIILKSYHKLKKDDELRAHFQLHFPWMSVPFFNERAELIAASLLLDVGEDDAVCVVPFHLYPLVDEYIRKHVYTTKAELSAIKAELEKNPGPAEYFVGWLYVVPFLVLFDWAVRRSFSVLDSAVTEDPEIRE